MRRYRMLQGLIGALFLVCTPLAHADEGDEPADVPSKHVTQDPIGDAFVELFDRHEAEVTPYEYFVLYVLPIDINQDGRLDVMLSANFYRNGKQGQMWLVFFRVDKGYVSLDYELFRKDGSYKGLGPIQFYYETVRVRPDPDSRSTSFYAVGNGGGGSGLLEVTRIWKSGMEQQAIALLERQDEEDDARIASLGDRFDGLEAHVYLLDFGPLQAHYAERLHRTPQKQREQPGSSDGRHVVQGDRYLQTLEEAYALLDGKAVNGSVDVPSPVVQPPPFETAEQALAYYMKDEQGEWRPAPVAELLRAADEEALIACLYPWVDRSEDKERAAVVATLMALAHRSSQSEIRQHFVERALTGGLGEDFESSKWTWLNGFTPADFNDPSKAHVLRALEASKTETHPYVIGRGAARWVGILGLEAAIPTLQEINAVQRGIEHRRWNPFFYRTALIALGRLGDPDAVREMIEGVEEMDTPRYRALSLQRLALLRTPETVAYLKRYLFSDVEYDDMGAGWLPVSETQCAADTLRAILEGFPETDLEVQRRWMEDRTEFTFKPAGTEAAFPGLR